MDDLLDTNRQRWNALANANVDYSKPYLDYTPEMAADYVYRHGIINDVKGKRVLCLANGGGQQSVAFGLLGAQVTVLDLSDVQLERDRQGAAHHGLKVETIHGDMRDLSIFPANHFDVVWQGYSINFVPSVVPVIQGAARILKTGGIYYLDFANPFTTSVDDEAWNGDAYPLKHLYLDGEEMTQYFPHWDVGMPDGSSTKLDSPREFRHKLSTVLNTLIGNGFILLGLWEWMREEENPEPGSWAHFTQVAPPWFGSFWRLEV